MLQGKLTTESTLTGSLDCAIVEPTLAEKNITENGSYNASADNVDGYSKVNVDVPTGTLAEKNITANGTYNASDDNVDGFSRVVVDVPTGTLPTPVNLTPNEKITTVHWAYYLELGDTIFCTFCFSISNKSIGTTENAFTGLPIPNSSDDFRFNGIIYASSSSHIFGHIESLTGNLVFDTNVGTSSGTRKCFGSFFYKKGGIT